MPFSKSEKFVNNDDDDDDDDDDEGVSCPLECNVVRCLVDNYRLFEKSSAFVPANGTSTSLGNTSLWVPKSTVSHSRRELPLQ
jgi:hypothetical protein